MIYGDYVFYGGVIRPKKSVRDCEVRSMLRSMRDYGFKTWVHASNLIGPIDLPEASLLTQGLCDDEQWAKMISGARAVICPYDTRIQCVSGVIAEAISVGTPVIATSFSFALEMSRRFPESTITSDDLTEWPRLATTLRTRRRPAPSFPSWAGFTDALLHELAP